MLPLFTQLLGDFIVRHLLVPRARVFFGPPDQDFVNGLPSPGTSVNAYLADLRENRKFRTNERFRTPLDNGKVREDPYPAWVDAHYLISAWDQANDANRAALNEQAVLRDLSAALLTGDPLTPNVVYGNADASEATPLAQLFGVGNQAALASLLSNQLALWPAVFQEPGLPYEVLPPEGFPNLSYFWTAMGQGAVWRAVVYLIATVPVELADGPTYTAVTTMTTTTGQWAGGSNDRLVSGTEHAWYQIGGSVTGPIPQSAGPPINGPIVGARVTLQEPGDATANPPRPPVSIQEMRTDTAGRYQFVFAGAANADLQTPATAYQVVVRYPGLQAGPLAVDLNPTNPVPHDVVLRSV